MRDCRDCVTHACKSARCYSEAAHMGLHIAQMTSQTGVRGCFDAASVHAAKVMHLEGYGLALRCGASFALQARDSEEAIRFRAKRLKVWEKGLLLANAPV